MYHCHLHLYFIGKQKPVWELLKQMPPLPLFTHTFMESDVFEEALAQKADVIFSATQDVTLQEVQSLPPQTELILLANSRQIAGLEEAWFARALDIWILPMSDKEIHFRFLQWQKSCKADKDFWETRHFLDAAINNTPNLIWFKDINGIHEKVNDSFCQTVNKTKQQVQGRSHAYIWDVEQDDPACIESENRVMRTRRTHVSEETVKAGDGVKLLTTYKSPLYDLDGSVMGTVGIAIDITKERAYEQEIIQKNHTLETIFTTIDCGVVRHTVDGTQILSINRAALEILGCESQEEMMAEGFNLIASSVLEEDKPKLEACIRELKREGDSVSLEYRVQHRDGKIRHIMGNIKLLREHGMLFYQRFLLDCTAQKQEEREKERRQWELLQALSIDYDLVCYFDLDTGKVSPLEQEGSERSPFADAFVGNPSLEEGMARYIHSFVYGEDQEMLLQASSPEKLKKELTDKKQYNVNYRVASGNTARYYQMKAVLAGDWGSRHGIVIGFRNVDEEIRGEMEQKNLLEDALLQANKASRAKSAFLSNMSHDIRTPMNAIVGFTTLAVSHINNQKQVEEYLKKIMASGNHLLNLINDVLDMSRIESGKIQLEEKPCCLPDILHGLRNILQADIHAKQLELYMDAVDVVDEEIFCDRLHLNQALLNLLGNSVKYTGAGGSIHLRVAQKPNAPKGYGNYEFTIRDTGIGMSADFVKHIFEPFEREKTSTISGIPGTGLGMSITKNIVDLMNGSISVKSEQDVGTEFKVSLTFRLNPDAKKIPDIPELKNFRALVVDDDFNSCDSVSYMLGQLGMRAEWTLSGKEAILRTKQAAMRNDDYGVYIVDWLLPDMNGVEVTRRIRKEMGERVPVIVLTAYDWSDIEEEAREAGVTAFCSKPLFMSELQNCLRNVMQDDETKKAAPKKKEKKLRTGRILLAEDNSLNQEIAVTILEEAGFCADVASTGKIAVEMLSGSEPGYYQLVLMDVQMPVMNGYEATKAIRSLANKELSSIPIIAMTANAFEEDKQEALECGMNGHIAKPIDITKLLDTLDKMLA